MIALLLQAVLGPIGTQALPPRGCAAFLWSPEPRQLVAMAVAEPGTLRLQLDGKTVDLPRVSALGTAGRGFPASARYASGELSATLDLTVTERPDLADGAVAPEAMLTVERTGQDAVVAPLAGLIGCVPVK